MTDETIIVGGYINTTLIKAQEILAQQAQIGGFSIEGGRLVWTQSDYFGGTSRSLKLGSGKSKEGVVNVTFDAAYRWTDLEVAGDWLKFRWGLYLCVEKS